MLADLEAGARLTFTATMGGGASAHGPYLLREEADLWARQGALLLALG